MNGTHWLRLTACENVPPREGRSISIGDREIAVFNLGQRFLAVENRCPHRGGPLADGIVSGNAVVCPLHAWKVDLESGAVVRPSGEAACVSVYGARVEDGVILIEVPDVDAPNEQRCSSPETMSTQM